MAGFVRDKEEDALLVEPLHISGLVEASQSVFAPVLTSLRHPDCAEIVHELFKALDGSAEVVNLEPGIVADVTICHCWASAASVVNVLGWIRIIVGSRRKPYRNLRGT